MYQLNILQHIHRMVDWFMRCTETVAWLWVLHYPLHVLNVDWIGFAATRKRLARTNGQVMVLERALNLKYMLEDKWATAADTDASGGIWIENTASLIPTTFIYTAGEAQPPLYIYGDAEGEPPLYIYSAAEYESQYDFIVKIPAAFAYDEDEVKAFVTRFRVAGKRFAIETY